MKSLPTLLCIFFTSIFFAQSSITKDISAFNEIKVFDLIEAELIPSDKNQVVISGFNIEDVKIVEDEAMLRIRMNTDTRFNGDDTQVKVYYTSVAIIDSNEGSFISSSSPIEQENIIIKTQEGGKVKVALATKSAEFKAVTGGVITVSGTSDFQEILINSGGEFNGQALQTQETKVKVTAGGSADVFATQKIDARVRAGGYIYIYGDPKDVTKKKFAGGKIVFKN